MKPGQFNWIRALKLVAANTCIWTAIACFVLGVRYYNLSDIPFVHIAADIPHHRIWANSLLLGLFAGVVYSIFELWLDASRIYNLSLGMIILLRTGALFIVSIIALFLAAFLNYYYDVYQGTVPETPGGYKDYIYSTTVFFLFLAAFFANLILSVFYTLRSKIGPVDFKHLILGRYRNPREERRIFLFLDLRSSTTIAEKLGHQKYSALIQSCFKDLTKAIVNNDAEVYQYVGDEVVLSWPVQNGATQCLQFYFDLMDRLASKGEFYEKVYGVMPFFKAGAHVGNVTAVEVGVIKRAIVYHGDVLNTAARIQSLCNEYQAALLISEALMQLVPDPGSPFTFEHLGEILLKGKAQEVALYAVHQKNTH